MFGKSIALEKNEKKLTCKEVQKQVVPYIKKELSDHELKKFIRHIDRCPECREELETYYIVYKGLMQLDEDENLPTNMMEALDEDLDISENHLKNMSLFHICSELIQIMTTISSVTLSFYWMLMFIRAM